MKGQSNTDAYLKNKTMSINDDEGAQHAANSQYLECQRNGSISTNAGKSNEIFKLAWRNDNLSDASSLFAKYNEVEYAKDSK
jgi:hypothetical protein